MALSIVDIPPLVKFVTTNWRQTGGVIYNRSEFTGRTRALRIGPAARWTCDFEIVPTTDAATIEQVRSFLAIASRHDYAFRLPMTDAAQSATVTGAVNGAGQLGDTLAIDGLPVSTSVLGPGGIISVAQGSDDEQPLVLLTVLSSNGSGQATVLLNTPLRRAPADNAVVKIASPIAIMRLRDAMSYQVQPGLINTWPSFTAEEAF